MSECQYDKLVRLPLVPGISVHVGGRLFTALASFGLLYLLAGQSGSQSLYWLAAATLAAITLGIVLPFLQILDTKVSVSMPGQAISGQKAIIQLQVSHAFLPGSLSRVFPLRLISLAIDLSRQNGQIISACAVPAIADGVENQQSIEAPTIPLKRGVYKFDKLTASTCFPFAICWWSTKLPVNLTDNGSVENSLIIYPHMIKMTGPLLQSTISGSTSLGKLNENHQSFQESCSVKGLRPYRVGDSPRWIHWKSTARSGRLIMKEFDGELVTDQFILLDTEADWQCEEQFELAVCLANSMIHCQSPLLKRKLLVSSPQFANTLIANKQSLEGMREILARVQSNPQSTLVDYPTAEKASLARLQALFGDTLKLFPNSTVFAVIPGEDAIAVNLLDVSLNTYGRLHHRSSTAQHHHVLASKNITNAQQSIAMLDKPTTDSKQIIARITNRSQISLL